MNDDTRKLFDEIKNLLGEVVNRGLFKKLEPVLEKLARTPDEDIDEEFLNLLDELCQKLCGNFPTSDTMPRLRELLEELCKVRRPRLRLIYPNPDQVQEHIAEINKTKKLKM